MRYKRMLEKPDLSDQTAFITGSTRGIGKAIALSLADQGCNVVSTGRTSEKDDVTDYRNLQGTIEQTAREARNLGVEAMSVQMDLREKADVKSAVDRAIDRFGQVNIVINNAGIIQIANIEDLRPARFDRLTEVNVRGTYLTSRAFLDHLKGVDNSWILTNAPPVDIDRHSYASPYVWSKLGMTFLTLSLAMELDDYDVGCNTFWPVTAIDTRATRHFGIGTEDDWRSPTIISDAILEILCRDPSEYTGNTVYDEDLLRNAGLKDFSRYNITEGDPTPLSAQPFNPEYIRSE